MYNFNSQLTISPINYNDEINRAHRLYQRAIWQGWLGKLLGKMTHRGSGLLDLNLYADRLRLRGQYYAGIQAVNIDQIRGSQGKGTDFDNRFAPLNERTRTRWMRIAAARFQGTPLPPVELIQVGDTYFVIDGHHRISVARALGQQSIDAQITKWSVSRPLPWENSSTQARLASQTA
jgi:hypothetical protein